MVHSTTRSVSCLIRGIEGYGVRMDPFMLLVIVLIVVLIVGLVGRGRW